MSQNLSILSVQFPFDILFLSPRVVTMYKLKFFVTMPCFFIIVSIQFRREDVSTLNSKVTESVKVLAGFLKNR